MYYAGIDYHKSYSTVCILDQEGEIVRERTIRPNLPEHFSRLFNELDASLCAVFECGLNYGYLYDLLEELPCVDSVVMANAYRTRIIAEAQIKTDKIDARKLAWLLRADLIPEVHVASPTTRARREVVRARAHWVKTRTQLRNRIHRITERNARHLQLPEVKDLFGKAGKIALGKARLPAPDDMLLKQHLDALKEVDAKVSACEKQMRADKQTNSDIALLEEIKGQAKYIKNKLQ